MRGRPWRGLIPLFITLLFLCLGGAFVAVQLRDQAQTLPHVPTNGVMFHAFGVPVDYQRCGFHTGSDWAAPTGTPIYAITDALVIYVGPLWLAGPGVGRGDKAIILDHGDYYTTYGHNSATFVAVGERVTRGQVIGEIGAEGYAGGPHLHIEKVMKATAPFTGNWQEPFVGCDGYVDPGAEGWSLW